MENKQRISFFFHFWKTNKEFLSSTISFLPKEYFHEIFWPSLLKVDRTNTYQRSRIIPHSNQSMYRWISCLVHESYLYHTVRSFKYSQIFRWNIQTLTVAKWHSLRLNADLADTPLQKSLRQFFKYCWQNLNYGKNYIFISNTFSMLKFIFFC